MYTYFSQGVSAHANYTCSTVQIFHGEMSDVEVKWLNERWKTRNDTAPLSTFPRAGYNKRVPRKTAELIGIGERLFQRCFTYTSLRIYHFAVIGKLRFVPIEITISRFSNWPRTEVTNHISKREGSRLYMRSGENPFCSFNHHHSVIISSFLFRFPPSLPPPPFHLTVSLAFLILTDSKPRMHERVIGGWKGTGRRKRGRRDE